MADLVLLAILAAGFLLGFAGGAVRVLMGLGVWLVAFLIGAHGRSLLADWLAGQWTQFSRPYVEMLCFAIIFLLVLGVGLAAVIYAGGRTTLTRQERLDELIGGVLGVALAALLVGGAYVILATIYAQPPLSAGQEARWLRDVYAALQGSAIVAVLRESLIPALAAILGPVLPSDVRAAMD